jgi:putative endonuclease
MGTSGGYYVYILSSGLGGTLYIGVTSDLVRRVYEHKTKTADGFTKEYDVDRLVYYEHYEDVEAAIRREKRLKRYNRGWKISLIEEENPNWVDLYLSIAKP